MEIVQTIVTALAAGAAAALQTTAGQAVQDAYGAVKALIQRKYASVDLVQLEKQPASPRRQALLNEELAETTAATDPEVLAQVQRLLEAIANHAPAAAATIGVDLTAIQAASLQVQDVIAQGTGAVTGVKGHGVTTTAGITISGVRATQTAAAPQTTTPPKIKILFLAASPHDNVPLRTAEEARAIDHALRQAAERRLEIVPHGAVQIEDLQALLLRHRPQIVHFSGHGSTSNTLLLQAANGTSIPVPAAALRDLFGLFKEQIRCVVLNACYTAEQATAIATVIDCVVGMADAISDEAARHFATAFYHALGEGESVQRAYELGRNLLALQNLNEADLPVLIAQRADPGMLRFTT